MFDILWFYSHSVYLQLVHHSSFLFFLEVFSVCGYDSNSNVNCFHSTVVDHLQFDLKMALLFAFSSPCIWFFSTVRCGWKWKEMYFVFRPNMPVITWVYFSEGTWIKTYYWCRTRMSQVLNGNYCLCFSFASDLVRACWCISSFKFNCKFAVINLFFPFLFLLWCIVVFFFLEAIIMIDG